MNELPVATYIIAGLCAIVAVVGGVVTITSPDTLTFKQYLDAVSAFAIGVGILAVGRGINNRRGD
jgi:ribose/xylose/arabinose/galactoside ABC-type transport system permease subunit